MFWTGKHILVQGLSVTSESQGAYDLSTIWAWEQRKLYGNIYIQTQISLHICMGGIYTYAYTEARLSDLSQIPFTIQDRRTEEFILPQR